MTREFIGDTRPQYSDAVERLIEGVLGYLAAKGISLEEDVKNQIAVNVARDSDAILGVERKRIWDRVESECRFKQMPGGSTFISEDAHLLERIIDDNTIAAEIDGKGAENE